MTSCPRLRTPSAAMWRPHPVTAGAFSIEGTGRRHSHLQPIRSRCPEHLRSGRVSVRAYVSRAQRLGFCEPA